MSLGSIVLTARLAELGTVLPPVARPVADYVPAVRMRDLVYTSGQLPMKDGELAARGILGGEVSVEEGAELARLCTLNALAAIAGVVVLDAVRRVVKLTGFVASAPGFTQQSAVINGASGLIRDLFGSAGDHTRSAIGVAALPLGAPVEVELIVEIDG